MTTKKTHEPKAMKETKIEATEEKRPPIEKITKKIDALNIEVEVYRETISGEDKVFAKRSEAIKFIREFRADKRVPTCVKVISRYFKRLNKFELGKQVPNEMEEAFFKVLSAMNELINFKSAEKGE